MSNLKISLIIKKDPQTIKPVGLFYRFYNLVKILFVIYTISSPYVEIKSAISYSCSTERSTLYENIAA